MTDAPPNGDIRYGGFTFYRARLYRVSHRCQSVTLRGRKVWVHALVRQFGCDWLRVTTTAQNGDKEEEWYVKPGYVIPDR